MLRGLIAIVAIAMSTAAFGQVASRPDSPPPAAAKPVASANELIQMAGTMSDMGRFDEAITALTIALSQEPDNPTALADRAIAYGWTNRVAEARADLDRAESLVPDRAVFHRIRAIIANRLSDQNLELRELTKSLELEPGNAFALRFRASIYRDRRQYDAALADADAFVRAAPDKSDGYLLRSLTLFEKQEFADSRDELDRLVRRFWDDWSAQTEAARIYLMLADRKGAMESADRAIRLNDRYYRVWEVRAGLRRRSDLAGRRLDLSEAAQLAPGDLGIEASLGLLSFDEGKWDEALAHFDAVLAKEDRDFGVLAYRANSLLKKGDQAGAERSFRSAQAVASGPGDFRTICWALAREALRLDWALDSCSRAVEAQPERATYLLTRGSLFLKRGEAKLAMADYDKAIAINPDEADAVYGRAIAFARLGKTQLAGDQRARALSMDPQVSERFQDFGFNDFEEDR